MNRALPFYALQFEGGRTLQIVVRRCAGAKTAVRLQVLTDFGQASLESPTDEVGRIAMYVHKLGSFPQAFLPGSLRQPTAG